MVVLYAEQKFSEDFMSKLPGVNTKNVSRLLTKGKSLDHLITLSKDELAEILDHSVNAELLYNALHHQMKGTPDASSNSYRVRNRGTGAKFRKRKHEVT